MTSLRVIETGEVVEQMTKVEAERITARIADKLDGIADNIEQVMPLIREALTREAWRPLGYSGATAYVSERFAGAFQRLPRAVRQPIVAELSSAGMSTRAIAPIVGASQMQVARDARAGETNVSPGTAPQSVDMRTGEVHDGDASPHVEAPTPTRTTEGAQEARTVVGMDGKNYTRNHEPQKPRRRPITDAFFTATYDLCKNVERLERLAEDDRFTQNKEQIALKHKNDLLRAADTLARVLQQIP